MPSTALGGVSVHHRDLHPGSCSARPQGKPGDDSGLKAVHSGETHTHTHDSLWPQSEWHTTREVSLHAKVFLLSWNGISFCHWNVEAVDVQWKQMNAYCILWSSKQSACMTEELTSHIFSECSFGRLQLIWKSYTDTNSSWGLAPIFLSVDDIFNFLPQLILVVIRWLQSSIMLQWLSYCLPIVCPPVERTESYLGFYFVPTLEKLSCRVSSQPHDMSFWLLHGVLVLWCVGVFVCVESLHFLWWCLISTG